MPIRLLLSLFAFMLIFFGCWLPAEWLLNRPLGRLDYERIRLGMSLDEVADILDQEGEGGFSSLQTWMIQSQEEPNSWGKLAKVEYLSNQTRCIFIEFDSQDRVIAKYYQASTKPSLLLRVYFALPLWSFMLAEVIGLLILVSLYLTRPKKPRRHAQAESMPIPVLTSSGQAESRRKVRWFLRPFEVLPLSRLLMFLVSFGLWFFGFWLVADWLLNRHVSRLSYERIRVGMSLTQAESIMGRKAGGWWDGTSGHRIRGSRNEDAERASESPVFYDSLQTDGESTFTGDTASLKAWTNHAHRIVVLRDSQGIVVGKSFSCRQDVTGMRRAFDMLPLWSILLMAVIGLLPILSACFRWWKKSRRRLQTYSPSVTIPAFLRQDASC